MMWTWAEICVSPSTLTTGDGGVCAIRGSAVPTTARTEMIILTDLRMGPRILNDDSFVDIQPPPAGLRGSIPHWRGSNLRLGAAGFRDGLCQLSVISDQDDRSHTMVHVRFTPDCVL